MLFLGNTGKLALGTPGTKGVKVAGIEPEDIGYGITIGELLYNNLPYQPYRPHHAAGGQVASQMEIALDHGEARPKIACLQNSRFRK